MKLINMNVMIFILVLFHFKLTSADISTTAAFGMSSDYISLWDWSTNNFSFVFDYCARSSVFFLKDGRLAGQTNIPTVNIFNVTSGTIDLTLNCSGFVFEELYNGWFVTGESSIQVWNISSTGTLVKTIPSSSSIKYLKGLSNGRLLSVAYGNGNINIFDSTNDFILYNSLIGHIYSVWVIEELPNGNILTCSSDMTAKLWNVTQSAYLTSVNPFSDSVYALRMISPDTFILGGGSTSIYVYKITSANEFVLNGTLPIPTSEVYDMKVTNTNLVIVSFDDDTLSIYNRTNMQLINNYPISGPVADGSAVYISVPKMYNYEDLISTDKKQKEGTNFKIMADYTMEQSNVIGSPFEVNHRLNCLITCKNNALCRAVTYDSEKKCTMFSANPQTNSELLVSSIGTHLYCKF